MPDWVSANTVELGGAPQNQAWENFANAAMHMYESNMKRKQELEDASTKRQQELSDMQEKFKQAELLANIQYNDYVPDGKGGYKVEKPFDIKAFNEKRATVLKISDDISTAIDTIMKNDLSGKITYAQAKELALSDMRTRYEGLPEEMWGDVQTFLRKRDLWREKYSSDEEREKIFQKAKKENRWDVFDAMGPEAVAWKDARLKSGQVVDGSGAVTGTATSREAGEEARKALFRSLVSSGQMLGSVGQGISGAGKNVINYGAGFSGLPGLPDRPGQTAGNMLRNAAVLPAFTSAAGNAAKFVGNKMAPGFLAQNPWALARDPMIKAGSALRGAGEALAPKVAGKLGAKLIAGLTNPYVGMGMTALTSYDLGKWAGGAYNDAQYDARMNGPSLMDNAQQPTQEDIDNILALMQYGR